MIKPNHRRHRTYCRAPIHSVYEDIEQSFTLPQDGYREIPGNTGYDELERRGLDWRSIPQEKLVEMVPPEPQWQHEVGWARNDLRKVGLLACAPCPRYILEIVTGAALRKKHVMFWALASLRTVCLIGPDHPQAGVSGPSRRAESTADVPPWVRRPRRAGSQRPSLRSQAAHLGMPGRQASRTEVNRRTVGRFILAALPMLLLGCQSAAPSFSPTQNSTVFLRSSTSWGWIEFENLSNHRLFVVGIDGDGWAKCDLPKGRHLVTRYRLSSLQSTALGVGAAWREVRCLIDVPENGVACYVGNLVLGPRDISVGRDDDAAADYHRRDLAPKRRRLVVSMMVQED